jgi:hypothetical protein
LNGEEQRNDLAVHRRYRHLVQRLHVAQPLDPLPGNGCHLPFERGKLSFHFERIVAVSFILREAVELRFRRDRIGCGAKDAIGVPIPNPQSLRRVDKSPQMKLRHIMMEFGRIHCRSYRLGAAKRS